MRKFLDDERDAKEIGKDFDALLGARTGDAYFEMHRLTLRLAKVKKVDKVEIFELKKIKEMVEELLEICEDKEITDNCEDVEY